MRLPDGSLLGVGLGKGRACVPVVPAGRQAAEEPFPSPCPVREGSPTGRLSARSAIRFLRRTYAGSAKPGCSPAQPTVVPPASSGVRLIQSIMNGIVDRHPLHRAGLAVDLTHTSDPAPGREHSPIRLAHVLVQVRGSRPMVPVPGPGASRCANRITTGGRETMLRRYRAVGCLSGRSGAWTAGTRTERRATSSSLSEGRTSSMSRSHRTPRVWWAAAAA